MNKNLTIQTLNSEKVKGLFIKLYGRENYEKQKLRYLDIVSKFYDNFDTEDIYIFSSPGRTEICGNHTDHNNGKVLGASINLDCIAIASKNTDNKINIISETFSQKFTIDLEDLEPSEKKSGTIDLIKGILKAFKINEFNIGGFDAYITSDVIASAGVSSSASFETLICKILDTFYNSSSISVLTYAYLSKYSENVYWDKQSGLLDQMCCAYGGLISIDFKDPIKPEIQKINFDFENSGFSLILVETGKGHADLSEDYSAIPNEMKAVANYFSKSTLSEVSEEDFYNNLVDIRETVSDRALMRAIHFFDENKRVDKIITSLENKKYDLFFKLIEESGNSSWKYLQNCYTNSTPSEQGISLALALTKKFIDEVKVGTYRIHGGGFAGVIMCLLPENLSKRYVEYIEAFMEKNTAHIMRIRPFGSICINELIN